MLTPRYRFHTSTWWLGVLVTFFCAVGIDSSAQQWRTEANQRIEQHRKANLNVEVVDTLGNKIEGAQVQVLMQAHDFGFGTAVPAARIVEQSANGDMFREKLLENFNQVVFENDMKWPAWDGLWGNNFNWQQTQQALDWLDQNNLPARGHYLSWATWSGNDAWGSSQNTTTLPTRLENHITDVATTVGDRVFEWDVINHPVGWLNDTYENRIASGLDFYAEIVNHARSVAPEGMPMWINEDDVIAGNSRAADYERIIDDLIANNASPDGIGFQGHFIEEWGRVSATPAAVLFDRIDRFADKGLRLRVTEFDVDVDGNEAYQGTLVNDYLTVMFSHPTVEAITLWGFWGGSHWRGENGALYRNDWSEKPSLEAYQSLVLNQWWTTENGVSNDQGSYGLRGFKGRYNVVVTVDDEVYELNDVLLTDNLSVQVQVAAAGLPGDFNGDGKVGLSDFTIWRNNLGSTFDLGGNGDESGGSAGVVDIADYDLWMHNFGVSSPSNLTDVGAGSIPEPCTLSVATLFCGVVAATAARHRRRVVFIPRSQN
ncbi:endo-1,4-beta-xylanase [Aeoliella sp.]|uniref:endo-1,4-beta-xylanase n=1 Tax=Aeoliella sp. TaxID=2795800 RepID=UPI003CCC2017